MTISESVAKMQETALAAKARLDGYGFDIKVETDYMNSMLRPIENPEKAKYVTTSLIVGGEGVKEGEEYCLSIGVVVKGKKVDDEQFDKDSHKFNEMVDEMIGVLDAHEDKVEGLGVLTAKANEEYEKLLAEIQENQRKSRRAAAIGNIVFFIGIMLLFIVAMTRS